MCWAMATRGAGMRFASFFMLFMEGASCVEKMFFRLKRGNKWRFVCARIELQGGGAVENKEL